MLPILNCDNCGACCLNQESPPGYLSILVNGHEAAASDEDLDRFINMPHELMQELQAYAKFLRDTEKHPNNGICIWFDEQTRKCKHYDLRPDICRHEVVVGDDGCLFWREEHQINL